MARLDAISTGNVVNFRRAEYLAADTARKAEILDELVASSGYHRKSVLRVLHRQERQPAERSDRRRGSRYAVIRPPLYRLWEASFYSCGKRLQPFLPELLRVMVRAGEVEVTAFEEELLLSISAATIDRLLAEHRRTHTPHGRSLTKPGTLLRDQIPVRTFAEWGNLCPGFFEIDLVAHCGGSGAGDFLYTLDMTDVCTGWVAMAPLKGKGQHATLEAIKQARRLIPFPVLGVDSDNGSEFINHHLLRYCQEEEITFTRCRPYKKNDQCHVEQKNWSVVRQTFGYARMEGEEQLDLLKRGEVLASWWHNFYHPMMRLQRKEREGSKVKRVYDEAKTPYQRLMAWEGILDEERRATLQARYDRHSPLALREEIRGVLMELRRSYQGQESGSGMNLE